MRIFYIIILEILLCIVTNAQTYSPLIRSNTLWSVQHGDGSQTCSLSGGDQYFFQGDDTLILGQLYQMVWSYQIVNINAGPYCPPFAVNNTSIGIKAYMREDTIAKKVYVFDQANNADALLYDFNLVTGDTLNSFYAGQGATLTVDSVSTIMLLNGAIRKIVYLNNNEFYIESIGGSQGLWFPLVQGTGYWEVPTCVSENSIHLFGSQCYGFLNVSEISNNNLLSVFPNPTQDFLQLKHSDFSGGIFTIFNLDGKIICVEKVLNNSQSIDISKLAPNTYIYSYEAIDSRKISGKFQVVK